MRRTVEASRGFVYAVSIMGVTGARDLRQQPQPRTWSPRPTQPAPSGSAWASASPPRSTCAEIAAYADGVIVGTALVAALRDGGVDAVARLTKDLSTGLTRK